MPAHPAPHAERVSFFEGAFFLVGGPAAWILQLCCGYAFASEPCFRDGGQRAVAVPAALHWTWPAMVVCTAVAFAVSLTAYFVSRRAFVRTRHETQTDTGHLLEVGAGRTRFLALWGMVLGAGFALASAFTAIGFILVPRCAN